VVTNNGGESRSRSTRSNNEGKDRGKNFKSGEKKDFKPNKNGGYKNSNKNNDSKTGGKFSGGKNFKKSDRSYKNPYDKDSEEDSRPQRRQAASKDRDNKVKEQQPDKIDIINRIEKEKKAMQKKQAERRNSKPVRQQARPKRTNNIDWTREYENGSYDDDDLDMYL
jgi:hypothetical protein